MSDVSRIGTPIAKAGVDTIVDAANTSACATRGVFA
jgi:hypothetical protein